MCDVRKQFTTYLFYFTSKLYFKSISKVNAFDKRRPKKEERTDKIQILSFFLIYLEITKNKFSIFVKKTPPTNVQNSLS